MREKEKKERNIGGKKKEIIRDARVFLLEFPSSANNRLFIANLPRIGRVIHRLEPTAFKYVPVVGGTLERNEGRENERRRNLSSLSGGFYFIGQ